MKKVLILDCPVETGGTGHEMAAMSIEEALKKIDKRIHTLCICPVKKSSKTAKYVSFVYLKLIKYTPGVMGYLHNSRLVSRITNTIRNKVDKVGYKRYKELISSFNPDTIVCTHAYPCWVVSVLKERENLQVPLVGILTDFYAHNYWPNSNVDKYVVATKEAKDDFALRGMSRNKIEVLGIPISTTFGEKKNKTKIRKKIKLKNKPTILVMGGGLGIGSIERIVKLLDNLNDIQIITVCGRNKKLENKLLKRKFKNKTIIKGYVENIDELMEVSDIAVTKAGGLTIAECLAKNLPMVLFRPLPGQEERNADYLVSHKLAVKLKNEEYLVSNVKKLLNKGGRKNNIAKPDSAVDTARLVLRLK